MAIESNCDQYQLGNNFDGQDWFWLPLVALY
jgi:hypothetical protein